MNSRDLIKDHVLLNVTDRVKELFELGTLEQEKNFDGKFNCKRALRENGWVWDEVGEYFFSAGGGTSFAEFERDLCEDLGLIPAEHFTLPLEYHLVSPLLAEALLNRRETVLSPAGTDEQFWGRMATNRAIHLDPIIRSIAELMDAVDLSYVEDSELVDLDLEDETVVASDTRDNDESSEDIPDDEDEDEDEDEESDSAQSEKAFVA
jgi:hypothetical protein